MRDLGRMTSVLPLLASCAGGPVEPAAVVVAAPPAALVARPTGAPAHLRLSDAEVRRCVERAAEPPIPCEAGDCAAQCAAADARACHRLGLGVASADPCGVVLLAAACDLGELSACVAAAGRLLGATDARRAGVLLGKACQSAHGPACTALARAVEAGAIDAPTGARDLFHRGCDAGDAHGCLEAAERTGEGAGERPGTELFARACELGLGAGCIEAASSMLEGAAGAPDLERARQLLDQACRDEDTATAAKGCYRLAQLVRLRPSAQGPMPRPLLERACEKGSLEGCAQLAHGSYAEGRYTEAVKIATPLVDGQPEHWPLREWRGLSLLNLGRFAEAAADLEVLARLRPDVPHYALLVFVARSRAGMEARAGLARAERALASRDGWPAPLFSLLLGKLTERAALEAAQSAEPRKQLEQQCEAFYYAAQKHMIEGRSAQARRLLQRAADTGVVEFVEHAAARAELARLSPNP
jgi:tetratricopeptide (TPR) repeat protein